MRTDRGEMRVLDVEAKQERLLATAWFDQPPIISERPFVWSPDSRWLAYVPIGPRLFRNVTVVRADGGRRRAA